MLKNMPTSNNTFKLQIVQGKFIGETVFIQIKIIVKKIQQEDPTSNGEEMNSDSVGTSQ